MEKNPAECKNSFRFGDVYICRLQTVPCSMLGKCALDQVNTFVKSMSALIDAIEVPQKEDRQ